MNAWPSLSLSELTSKIGSGATPRGGKEAYKEQGIPLIRSMNVYDLHFETDGIAYLDDEQASGLDNVKVQEGDVLLNITGASVARCCRVPSSMAGARVNQHVAIIRPISSKLDGQFLAYKLASDPHKSRLLNLASAGATREALTKGGLERYQIEAPPIETQRRIAGILGAYDNLIEVNRRRVAVLEEMARSHFDEWFVRFRFPGHETVPMIDTPDGSLPLGWEWSKLGNLARLKSGNQKLTKKAYREAGVKAYSASGPDGFVEIAEHKGPAVIVSAVGAYCGKTWLADGPWTAIANTFAMYPNEGVPAEYLFLGTYGIDKWPRRGAAQPFIAKSDAANIKLPRPPEELLNQFSALANPLFKSIELALQANNLLSASRDLLLPRLISGQLSVERAERELEEAA